MSISTALKSRLLWGVVLGFIAGSLFAPPHFVAAETRTSLASLQAQVDALQSAVTSLESDKASVSQLASYAKLGSTPQAGSFAVTGTISGNFVGDGAGLTNIFTVGSGLQLTGRQISVDFNALDARYVKK